MAVAAGFQIGAYEVVAQLEAGGMGEVYRARDTKLNRDGARPNNGRELSPPQQT